MKAKPAAVKDLRERLLKVWFPNIYRNDNYMASYNFCQQCNDYFVTAKTKIANCICFVASFLQNCISFCWQQHERKLDCKNLVFPIQNKFKTFLYNNLGNLKTFVNNF